jgi:hypothetical protein
MSIDPPADRPAAARPDGADRADVPRDPLRPAATVARLERMGAFHQTRLSFVRSLVRQMAREDWRIYPELFEIDAEERGHARYAVETPHGRYSVVFFADRIDPDQRTDRVIAEAWDYTFALVEGIPDAADTERLRANVPLQEAGRMCSRDLVLSRANKSARLFAHVVGELAAGRQPDRDQIARIGYLIRTTAVYGNGKFGLADFELLQRRGPFTRPFSAQMLAVYVAREFSLDLVEGLARQRNPDAAIRLDPALRRGVGVGNATGLGMAPFVVSHPQLVHSWQLARETAIARVKAVPEATAPRRDRFRRLLARARRYVQEWSTDDAHQQTRIETLRTELARLHDALFPDGDRDALPATYPWRQLCARVADGFGLETQELVHSLILEPYPDLVDDLEDQMSAPEDQRLQPTMTVAQLRAVIERAYDWALVLPHAGATADGKDPHKAYFWYRSESKEEPRLGERCCQPGADRELPLDIGLRVRALYDDLCAADAPAGQDESVAEFLMRRPDWRALVRRIQTLADKPYAEVRENLLGRDMRPIDLLRFKLSFFGASKFDPKSDRWTRITLFQEAPGAAELSDPGLDPDDWAFFPTRHAESG